MTKKVKQTGPPARVGAYQISVIPASDSGILTRAVLVDKSNRNHPGGICMTTEGLEIDADNVASDSLVEIPSDVLRGMLRVSGWKCEYPDALNPHFNKEMGK